LHVARSTRWRQSLDHWSSIVSKFISTVLAIMIVAAGSAAAQQPAPDGGQAQLESVEVLVDAVVLDKDRRPMAGLTASDFEVLEDGIPQPITRVKSVGRIADASAARGAGAAPLPSGTATYHTIVVTDGTVEDVHLADVRAAIEKYVQTVMTSDDYVTLFTIGTGGLRLLQTTTNDKQAIVAALANTKTGGIGTLRAAEKAGIDLARVRLPGDAYSTYAAPGTEEGTSSSGTAGVGAAEAATPPDAGEVALRLAKRSIEQAEEMQALGISWTIYDALTALIDAHRVLPGRRSITLFSEGLLQVKQVQDVKERVLNAAAAAGVTLYVIDARGLDTASERGSTSRAEVDRVQNAAGMRGSDFNSERTSSIRGGIFDNITRNSNTRTDILAEFASRTGGLFMKNSNDLFKGLAEIDRDQRSYYLIYYAPTRDWETGEYRKISVRVKNHAGATVRAREGYFAIPTEARGLFRLEDQRLYIRAHQDGARKSLPFTLRSYAFGIPAGGTRVSYALTVPAEAISLTESDEKALTGSYYGLLIARDSADRVLATGRIPINLNLTPEQAAVVRAEGLRLEGGFDVAEGDVVRVEAILSGEQTGSIGSSVQQVRGLDWSSGPAASDIVLGRNVVAPEGAGEPSFQTGGKYLVPLATPVFSQADAMTILAAVYWPEGRAMKKPVLSIWQGKQLLASLELDLMPASGGASGWVFTAIPCKDIPAGDYLMRLNVRDEQGRSSMRESKFSVK